STSAPTKAVAIHPIRRPSPRAPAADKTSAIVLRVAKSRLGSRWQAAVTVLPSPLARRVAAAACAAVNRQRPWRDRRQLRPQHLRLPAQLKQLVSCSKCGADRNNCALSRRRSWTRAKKRSVKSARSIWSMIHRLIKDKNRIAAAKQVNDSRVRHFSRATYLSNAFQNVR